MADKTDKYIGPAKETKQDVIVSNLERQIWIF